MEEQEQDNLLSIQDLFGLCVSKWRWIVLSVASALTLGVLYIVTTPPTYTRTASLLIKQDQKGGSAGSDMASAFSDMGIFKSNSNVNNELLSIQSPSTMLEVVRRLNLEVSYKKHDLLYDKTLYGTDLPVLVDFITLQPDESASLRLELSGKSFKLKNFRKNKASLSGEVSSVLGSEIDTPIGRLFVRKNPIYQGREEVFDILINRRSVMATTMGFSKNLSASLLNKDATVISLSIKDKSVQRADDILNTLVAVYNENWIKDKNQVAIATSNFIGDRLQLIEKELGDVDKDISNYKSEHLLPDVREASKMYMTTANDVNSQLVQLRTQQYVSRYIRNYLAGDMNRHSLLPQISGVNNQSIEKLIADYNTKVLERNNLIANSSGSNPLVVDLDQAIGSMRAAIISSIDNQIVSINEQIRSLQGNENEIKSRIAENPTQAKYLLSVERQQKVKEALYLYLLQKREENELTQAFTAYNTRVITPPMGLAIPTSPRKAIILLAALLIGLIIPIALIYILEITNNTLRGKHDLEGMKMPFIGEIPQIGRKKLSLFRKRLIIDKEQKRKLVVKEGSRNMINEAFRVIRTNMEFITGSANAHKVIMVTSANPSSGKTFVTINTAASYALKNSKVLLVDLDMRKPAMSESFGNPIPGIADYLGERIESYESFIRPVEGAKNLDVVTVGTIPPNPSELLYSDRLKNFLEDMKQKYDLIFIDCPPIEIVADAAIINSFSDMTLFIIRAGILDKRLLPMIDELYTTGKYKNMGLILNGTDIVNSRYGYNKYGYIKYGFGHKGYGYTADDEDQ